MFILGVRGREWPFFDRDREAYPEGYNMDHQVLTPRKELRQLTLSAHRAHAKSQLCFGLLTLILLQYEHEGHMDEHVRAHLSDTLLELDQVLSDIAVRLSSDDLPF